MIGLTSLFAGPLVGLFGSLGAGVLNFFTQRQKDKHELEMMQAQKELVVAQGANAVALEKEKQLAVAHESDKSTYANKEAMSGWTGLIFNFLMAIVDFMRGFTRPGLTWYFTVASTYFALYAIYMVGFDDVFLKKIAEYSIIAMLELMGTSVGFWFGTKGIIRLNGGRK